MGSERGHLAERLLERKRLDYAEADGEVAELEKRLKVSDKGIG